MAPSRCCVTVCFSGEGLVPYCTRPNKMLISIKFLVFVLGVAAGILRAIGA